MSTYDEEYRWLREATFAAGLLPILADHDARMAELAGISGQFTEADNRSPDDESVWDSFPADDISATGLNVPNDRDRFDDLVTCVSHSYRLLSASSDLLVKQLAEWKDNESVAVFVGERTEYTARGVIFGPGTTDFRHPDDIDSLLRAYSEGQ